MKDTFSGQRRKRVYYLLLHSYQRERDGPEEGAVWIMIAVELLWQFVAVFLDLFVLFESSSLVPCRVELLPS